MRVFYVILIVFAVDFVVAGIEMIIKDLKREF